MNPSQLNSDLADPQRLGGAILNDNGLKKSNHTFENEDPNDSGEDSDTEKPSRRSGRRKIKIEYIEDKNRRHITFSKRKAGIMKKAYELSTLTGTQVLLLVVSETGLVYTFTTVKLQPIVTKPEGKNLIQACLNAPDPMSTEQSSSGDASYNNNSNNNTSSPALEEKKPSYEDKKIEPPQPTPTNSYGVPPNGTSYPSQPYGSQGGPNNQMAVTNNGYSHPGYMGSTAPYQQSPQQQPQPSQPQSAPYGQMAQPSFYGNQQPHYVPHQQQQQQQQQPHPGYWQAGPPGLQRQDQSVDKTRRDIKK